MKFALDTNIYVDAFRDPAAEAALLHFIERALPFTFLADFDRFAPFMKGWRHVRPWPDVS